MRKSLAIMTFFGPLTAAGAAIADDDCFVPMANWQPREAVAQLAKENGWTVRRIKIDDGCYELEGRDAEGREIEATVDPATLAIIRIEREEDEQDDERSRGGLVPPATKLPPDKGPAASRPDSETGEK